MHFGKLRNSCGMLFHILAPNLEKDFNSWLDLEYLYNNCLLKKILYCNYVSHLSNQKKEKSDFLQWMACGFKILLTDKLLGRET